MGKMRSKTGNSINKKSPKLDKEMRRKTNLQGVENFQNLR